MFIKKGQVALIIVFSLLLSLFSVYLILHPIRDKLILIKNNENVLKAIYNSHKGLEALLLLRNKKKNLSLNFELSTYQTNDCEGLTFDSTTGTCIVKVYTPNYSNYWRRDEFFSAFDITFVIESAPQNVIYLSQIYSEGVSARRSRIFYLTPR